MSAKFRKEFTKENAVRNMERGYFHILVNDSPPGGPKTYYIHTISEYLETAQAALEWLSVEMPCWLVECGEDNKLVGYPCLPWEETSTG